MPNYPAGTVKVVIGGTLPNGEAFAFGYQLQGDPSWGQLRLDQQSGTCNAALANNFLTTTVKAHFSQQVVFQTLRLYLYKGGSTAALVSENTGLNIAGTNTSQNPLPNQLATVVSLLTGVPGRSNRGRAYLPPMTVGEVFTDGEVPATVCTQLATAFASMLSAVKAATNSANPVVASAAKGSMTPITKVAVDSIFDTQRRRRNKVTPRTVASVNLS